MGQRGILRTQDGDRLAFFCPGCKEAHAVNNGWTFNDNYDAPTFTPSILVSGVRHPTDDEVDRIMAGEKIEPTPRVCHSFVTDGKIQFLGDCTHALAGQTVPLEAF